MNRRDRGCCESRERSGGWCGGCLGTVGWVAVPWHSPFHLGYHCWPLLDFHAGLQLINFTCWCSHFVIIHAPENWGWKQKSPTVNWPFFVFIIRRLLVKQFSLVGRMLTLPNFWRNILVIWLYWFFNESFADLRIDKWRIIHFIW